MQRQDRDGMQHGLNYHGIRNVMSVGWNLTTPALYEEIVRRRAGVIAEDGPVVVRTGKYTGRSPKDKFLIREPGSEANIWWGDVNQPLEQEQFEALKKRMLSYLSSRDLYVQDCYAGADPRYRLNVRIITELAWHALFMRNLLIRPAIDEDLSGYIPDFTVICAPHFHSNPDEDGTRSETFILLNFATKEVLIGGTEYAGEMKKSVFTILNYLLPLQNVLSMHCSANYGPEGDVAIFFGLSGTGKTTLSSDPARTLIGDDEHGWSDHGVFNIEGGCYAKVIHLSPTAEPDIYAASHRFGTILENVAIDSRTRRLDLDDDSLTENTRAAYPITHIANADVSGVGGHPKNIIMLTADAFGVMPPIARLTPAQAQYYFLSGYTAKVAGTERGVTAPQATFSTCFGAPFIVHPPTLYARLLGERIARHGADAWLVNTGWTGGPAGGGGSRMSIAYTRAMVAAALDGSLATVETVPDPVFGVGVPVSCPGVPPAVLQPRTTWDDPAAYDAKARDLAERFHANFAQFADAVSADVAAAGPRAAIAQR
ncbi:MAG: phosphoenolpyruvate carboxykinase [Thermomicrobia bacterium]|nr:phosphoenolpyruvate carboxykinase [Thermomicrobia bacterium]MCA1724688.1 phosphoenolpyruvate carboxykinase [Thermomicrobia bacterium]